jgi:uncharacterized protein YceK
MKCKHVTKIMIVIIVFLGTSGCATVVVNGFRETEGSPSLEVRSRSSSLDGSYIGNVEIDGYEFARIVILEPRAACEDHSQIEMLLPLSAEKAAHPRLKEITGAVTEKGKTIAIRINVFDKSKARELTKAESWQGYPDNIIFRHEVDDPPTVLYRFGPAPSDVRDESVEDDLEWVCRSRAAYIGSIALLPFAVVFDILTFPVQLIIIALGH